MAGEVVLPKPSFSIWQRIVRSFMYTMMLRNDTANDCADRVKIMFANYTISLYGYVNYPEKGERKAELQEIANDRNNIETILSAMMAPAHKRDLLIKAADKEYKFIELEKKIGIPPLK